MLSRIDKYILSNSRNEEQSIDGGWAPSLPLAVFSSFQTGLVQASEVSGPLHHFSLPYHSPAIKCHWGHQGKVLANPKLCFPVPLALSSLLPSPLSLHVYTQFSLFTAGI